MFLINSRFPLVSAALTRSHQQVVSTVGAPLLPKLRGHFAEFLNHDSLDRLSILYLITCVGLGYGQLEPHADAFLGSIGSSDPHQRRGPSGLRDGIKTRTTDLPMVPPTSLDRDNHRPARLPSCVTPVNTLTSLHRFPPHHQQPFPKEQITGSVMVSIHSSVWAVLRRYGNINPLSIDYACRPRLRSRLTQGRLA